MSCPCSRHVPYYIGNFSSLGKITTHQEVRVVEMEEFIHEVEYPQPEIGEILELRERGKVLQEHLGGGGGATYNNMIAILFIYHFVAVQ